MLSRADTDTPPHGQPGTGISPPEPAVPHPAVPDGLTPRMALFAETYVSEGTGNASEAARQAGYPESDARQTGYRLLRHEAVRSYILHLTAQALAAVAPVALKTQLRLATMARSEFVQQQAAADLLDRAGFKPPDSRSRVGSGSVSITIDLGAND